jgi:HSP20 family protein
LAPWRQLEDEINRMLETGSPATAWTPPVNVYELDDAYTIEAEVPGFANEDIDVEIEGNVVTLKGNLKKPEEAPKRVYHRTERRTGGFERAFEIPEGFDAEKVVAALENGVLRVTLPKREDAKPKQIKVHVN